MALPSSNASAAPAVAQHDLMVSKVGTVESGDIVMFDLEVVNAGPSGAFEVFLVDTLPPELELVAPVPPSCVHEGSASGGVVECDLGPLPPGGAVAIELVTRVSAAASGTVTNCAFVENREVPPAEELVPANNEDCWDFEPEPVPPGLAATLTDELLDARAEPGNVVQGERFQYVFTVVNRTETAVSLPQVEFTLPRQVEPEPLRDCLRSAGRSGAVVVCPGGRVPSGGVLEQRLPVTVLVATPTTITAAARVVGRDDLADVEPTPLNGGPLPPGAVDLCIEASPGGDEVSVGATSVFRLSVRNAAAFPASGVVVGIDVPGGLTMTEGPGPTWRPPKIGPDGSVEVQVVLRADAPGGYRVTGAVLAVDQEARSVGSCTGADPAAAFDVAVSDVLAINVIAPFGKVFDDANANGAPDPGEDGIGGVPVELIAPSGAVVAVTGPNGDYRFDPAPAGSEIRVDPGRLRPTTPTVRLVGPGSIDFGLRTLQTIPATGLDAGPWLAAGTGLLALGLILLALPGLRRQRRGR